MTRLTSTTFGLSGARTERELRSIWHRVGRIPGVGQIAFEVDEAMTLMILKHKEEVVPDRAAVGEAVRAAGPFDVV